MWITQSLWISSIRLEAMLFNVGMQFTRKGLKDDGFTGFRPFKDLDAMRVPQGTGVFAVLRPDGFQPDFLKTSTAGVFKKKDPSLQEPELTAAWVEAAVVLYLGKAGPGSKGNRGLRRQIQEFLDFGQGKPPGHWDGRLVWQLKDAGRLLIAWKELPAEALNKAEADYHSAFIEEYGKLPFANLVRARVKNQPGRS
jgi:hypothetical protein